MVGISELCFDGHGDPVGDPWFKDNQTQGKDKYRTDPTKIAIVERRT